MTERHSINEDLLHAFIDGELDQGESTRVAQAVADDADLSARVASFRADKAAIAQFYGLLADRPLPKEWIARIEQDTRPRRIPQLASWAAIAAALVIAITSAFYFRSAPVTGEESIIREAIAARSATLSPQETLIARDVSQARAIDRTMADALKMRLRAPDLARMGYKLASALVYDAVSGNKAVELVYRGAGKSDVTIYVRKPTSAVRFDQFKRDGLRICVWQDEVLGTVISGNISAAEMQRIASLAYTGLEA
jgi:anti-sigma factor RsiW